MMLPSNSFAQSSLAVTVAASAVGSYVALSPPHQTTQQAPSTGDSIRGLNLTSRHFRAAAFAPLGFLALHTSSLIFTYPHIPSTLLRYGAENGLNNKLITWSQSTTIPLALMICAGIPLRLVSYASLGKNFTFTLAEPDTLKTDGIYRYIQHPSYTGLVIIVTCGAALFTRTDGVLSCWINPAWYPALRALELYLTPVGITAFLLAVWTRVVQEERMLREDFGIQWENWNAKTARFIPWIF